MVATSSSGREGTEGVNTLVKPVWSDPVVPTGADGSAPPDRTPGAPRPGLGVIPAEVTRAVFTKLVGFGSGTAGAGATGAGSTEAGTTNDDTEGTEGARWLATSMPDTSVGAVHVASGTSSSIGVGVGTVTP